MTTANFITTDCTEPHPQPDASQTVAGALAVALKRHGVEVVFGQSIPSALFMELPSQQIRQIGYRTENAGGTMADAYARITGRTGVVTAQNGPAATLLVPPLAEAMKASVPILAIVQDVPTGSVDKNAFQEYDHITLFQSCTKFARRVDKAERIDDYVDMAFTAANSGRPGPVALMFPMDFLRQPYERKVTRSKNLGAFPLDRYAPAPKLIADAAKAIAAAARPIVIAGGGVHLSGAAGALLQFAEASGIPVATTNMGKGTFPEIHPQALGVFSNCMGVGTRGHLLKSYIQDADLVILVGTRTNENGTDAWRLYPRNATFIHIDIDPSEIGRNYESVRLTADARSALQALTEALAKSAPRAIAALTASTTQARDGMQLHLKQIAQGSPGAVRPEYLMQVLQKHLRPDDIVCTDASYATSWVTTYLTANEGGQRFLTPRGLAGLGWGLPLALGSKVAHPGQRVIAVVGDGGFGHCWQELETAVRMQLPVTVIVLNNGILGFQYHAENVHYGRHTSATRFAGVDHAAIARACGCNGVVVEGPEQFEPALVAALASNVCSVLEIKTDENAYPPLSLFSGQPADRVTILDSI